MSLDRGFPCFSGSRKPKVSTEILIFGIPKGLFQYFLHDFHDHLWISQVNLNYKMAYFSQIVHIGTFHGKRSKMQIAYTGSTDA